MPAIDSFDATVTTVQFSAPADITGIERVMLAAQGDLQRLLSAFFAQPITIKRVFAHTSARTAPASPANPITQRRRVRLVCAGRTACVATSSVVLTSEACARLFLDDGFAIGQMFRKMMRVPVFALTDVFAGTDERGRRVLSRRYKLDTEGFECDIEEVFPDREMFVRCERWLEDAPEDDDEPMAEPLQVDGVDGVNGVSGSKKVVPKMETGGADHMSPAAFVAPVVASQV